MNLGHLTKSAAFVMDVRVREKGAKEDLPNNRWWSHPLRWGTMAEYHLTLGVKIASLFSEMLNLRSC